MGAGAIELAVVAALLPAGELVAGAGLTVVQPTASTSGRPIAATADQHDLPIRGLLIFSRMPPFEFEWRTAIASSPYPHPTDVDHRAARDEAAHELAASRLARLGLQHTALETKSTARPANFAAYPSQATEVVGNLCAS
jgi:hypothetical protein